MSMAWAVFLAIVGVALLSGHVAMSLSRCNLPKSMSGTWFLSGHPETVLITKRSLGWLGMCHRTRDKNKYVLYKQTERCYQCVALWPRHENVIEYKAGDCKETEDADMDKMCDISPDVTLNTLIRLDGQSIKCPFQGPVSFSYDKGTGLCSSPLSELSQCMTNAQLKLRYHACPDIPQTESRDEILTCLASWADDRDASQTFLVATLDDQYRRTQEDRLRCFLLKKTSNGFQVAQSQDATCHGGLSSPTDGFQTFQLGTKTHQTPRHKFPKWVSVHKRMLTFDFAYLYSFNEDRESFTVSNFTYTTKETILVSHTSIMQILGSGDDWMKLVIKSVSGCERIYQCIILHRRTSYILELEFGKQTNVLRAACKRPYFKLGSNPMLMLLSEQLSIQDCTLAGVHNVTSLSLDTQTDQCDPQGFSRLEVHCSSPQQVQFIRDCPNAADRATYFCQGGWKELGEHGYTQQTTPPFPFQQPAKNTPKADQLGLGFLIAKPKRRDSTSLRRVCLMYSVINDSYIWTVGKKGCNRDLTSMTGGHRFTTYLTGACTASAVTLYANGYLVVIVKTALEIIKC